MSNLADALGDGTRCIDYGGGVAVHWYPPGKPGAKCWCGETTNDTDAPRGTQLARLGEPPTKKPRRKGK